MIPWSSTTTSFDEQKRKRQRSFALRLLLASAVPFVALAIQIAIWPIVQPFFWFVFYPAVFLSAWIAGFAGGLISTILSTLLCWFYFIPPEGIFIKAETKHYITSVVFFFVGVLISSLDNKLRKTVKTLEQVRMDSAREETQLKEAQRIGNFGSWTWNIRKNQVEWSEQVYRIFGLEPNRFTLTYETFLSFVHPQDRELVDRSVNEAINLSKPYSIDHRILLPDGTEKFVQEVADVYLGDNGQPTEMMGTIHDITERKQIETAFKESERKFRGTLETACDPIIIVNENGLIEFANQQVKRSLGYESQELLGKPVELLIPERFRPNHPNLRNNYVNHPVSRPMGRSLQVVARKKDGSDLPVSVSLSPFTTKRTTIVTAFIRDMSEQKKHEAQQRFLFDTGRILSETTDYNERIQRIANLVVPPLADLCLVHILENNRLALKASAQRETLDPDLLKQVFADDFLRHLGSNFGPNFVATSTEGQLVEKVDEHFFGQTVDKDSDSFQKFISLNIQSWISVPMLARGRSIGVISFFRCKPKSYLSTDLDFFNLVAERAALAVDNARLYQEAQRAITLREDVLAIVSHDLKNPLSVIRGFNELRANSPIEVRSVKSDVDANDAVARSVRQMERLIGDLLDFAKIQSGTLSIEAKPCRIDQLIWDGVETVHHHLQKKALQINIEIQSDITVAFCDPDRIRQVFGNLLGNAVKFSPERGRISVAVKLKESEILFSVSDNGPGISPEHLEHLFDRYWQAKETAKLGTGLGLSIAKGIVESHYGRIWAESTPGHGTTFYFTLPAETRKVDIGSSNEEQSFKREIRQ